MGVQQPSERKEQLVRQRDVTLEEARERLARLRRRRDEVIQQAMAAAEREMEGRRR